MTTIPWMTSHTAQAPSSMYAMRPNEFVLSFRESSNHPRLEISRIQSFPLAYLNSSPGGSYLFNYLPYGIEQSRVEKRDTLAEVIPYSAQVDHRTYGDRRYENQAIVQKRDPLVIVRRRLEAIHHRGFLANLSTMQGVILRMWSAEREKSQSRKSDVEILQGIKTVIQEAIENGKYKIGRQRYEPEALVLADMMIGYIEKMREGISLSSLIADPKFDRLERTLITNRFLLAETYRYAKIYGQYRNTDIEDDLGIKVPAYTNSHRREELQDAIVSVVDLGYRERKQEAVIGDLDLGWRSRSQEAIADAYHPGGDRPNIYESDVFQYSILGDKDITYEATRYVGLISSNGLGGIEAVVVDWVPGAYGSTEHEATINDRQLGATYGGEASEALINWRNILVSGPDDAPMEASVIHRITRAYVDTSSEARISIDRTYVDVLNELPANILEGDIVRVSLDGETARITWPKIVRTERSGKTAREYDAPIIKTLLESQVARVHDPNQFVLIERGSRDVRYDFIDAKMEIVGMDARYLNESIVKVDKTATAGWLIHAIMRMSKEEKISLIWNYIRQFNEVEKDALTDEAILALKFVVPDEKSREAFIPILHMLEKAEKDSLIVPKRIADFFAERDDTDAIIHRLTGADRDIEGTNEAIRQATFLSDSGTDRIGLRQETSVAKRDTSEVVGVINQIIQANFERKRDAYIPEEKYLLVGDNSDWEDIWGKYSPGIDLLDVPGSDYDYSTLANKVYDPETGVPIHPIGPTNKPDVRVKIPLHHPTPNFADIGLDEVIVDNYIFMDVVLAVESLKERNKLRFAGMPAEKTIRELLSKLYAWVDQAAPGHPEYLRMFRFVRWYAEAAVTQVSEHILKRVYQSWISGIHNNQDLGIPYTSTGWKYMPNASVIQTTDKNASLSFEKQNYIDGEITIRGYFDNPGGQGTMEVKVDGTTVETLGSSHNGVFTLVIPVPQGRHNYEIVFYGDYGRVSLSSIEISGCVFVSATTEADDTNTNGLKTITTLIQMLLRYFDLHHGNGKVKGTMAVKQRKVWQQT